MKSKRRKKLSKGYRPHSFYQYIQWREGALVFRGEPHAEVTRRNLY
jgi:hypothetical protein